VTAHPIIKIIFAQSEKRTIHLPRGWYDKIAAETRVTRTARTTS